MTTTEPEATGPQEAEPKAAGPEEGKAAEARASVEGPRVEREYGVDLGFVVAEVNTEADARRWAESCEEHPDESGDEVKAVAVSRTVTTTPWRPLGRPGQQPPIEEPTDVERLRQALEAAAEWLNGLADSGPDLKVNAHHKAVHEARELAEDPNLTELADVVICLVGASLHHRWTLGDVADAVVRKVAINRARTWSQQPDGTWQHDEQHDEQPEAT